MNTFLPKVDSRDAQFHEKFGSVTDLPQESNFGDILVSTVEANGGEDCTALSVCKVCTSQTKVVYNADALWNDVPNNTKGVDPRITLGILVKEGLIPLKNYDGTMDKRWTSYWRCDVGIDDSFTNVQSAMQLAQSSAMVNTPWYENWENLSPLEVMPTGDTIVSYHSWVFVDWKLVNGVIMALIDWHGGQLNYMPQEVFNAAIRQSGMSAFMPSTSILDAKRQRTLMEWIIDLCQNCILLLKQLPVGNTLPPTSTELKWDTRGNCSHSVRVLCDEAGLTVHEKNLIWACIRQESDFLTDPVPNENRDSKTGQVWSRDFGIVQINDYYHIGEGKDFPSVQYVLDNPQVCVQWMIDMYKQGRLTMWASYTSGAYQQWLPYQPIQ